MKYLYEITEEKQTLTRDIADWGEIEARDAKEAHKKVLELYIASHDKNAKPHIRIMNPYFAEYRSRINRYIKRMTHEEIDALSDEERKKRRKHIDTVTALEAHDIICRFAEMGYMFSRSHEILRRAEKELEQLEYIAMCKAKIAPQYPIDEYGQKIE